MALIQTRRTFLSGIAAAGTAGLIRTRWAEAAEGPLETTTFGCRRVASAFPRCTSPSNCCALRALPISAISKHR